MKSNLESGLQFGHSEIREHSESSSFSLLWCSVSPRVTLLQPSFFPFASFCELLRISLTKAAELWLNSVCGENKTKPNKIKTGQDGFIYKQ